MEQVDENAFNTQALSFDSTLDSLLDGNFVVDEKSLPFEPSPDLLMSAQKSYRADISHNGDGENSNKADEDFVVIETLGTELNNVDETVTMENGINHEAITEVMDCVTKINESVSELPDGGVNSKKSDQSLVKTNIDSSSADHKESGLNFDKIKEKRKRNLANQKSSAKKVSPNKNKISKDSADTTSKVQDESTEEPPAKRKRSNDSDKKCVVSTPLETKCPFAAKASVCPKADNINHNLSETEIVGSNQEKKEVGKVTEEGETLSEINSFELFAGMSDAESTEQNITNNSDTDDIDIYEDIDDISDVNTTLVEDLDNTEDNNMMTSNVERYNSNNGDDDDDDDIVTSEEEEVIDDDEIHGWLEEGVTKPPDMKEDFNKELKEGEFVCRDKHVVKEKGITPFDVLPSGWIKIFHDSGMPVFLHKASRVCTFARPYFIGKGSTRKHDIPMSAIPCLHYRHELKKEEEQALNPEVTEEVKQTEEEVSQTEKDKTTEGDNVLPKAALTVADESQNMISLEPKEFTEYCRGLFHFNTLKVKRFKTWREKRAHLVQENRKKRLPKLAADTKLITCPIPADNNKNTKKPRKKEFVINPEGKTAVCILHEYTQNVIRVQPSYEFKEIQNPECPFKATVLLNGIQYGSGCASGKRQAKNEAAKATLHIFLPELTPHIGGSSRAKPKDELSSDLHYFEEVSITDPRVPDLCNKASLPLPYQVLQTCLQRNFGLGDTTFTTQKKMITNQRSEFILTVGKRTCSVICKNKREGKQQAAQAMLQQLHPELKNWASILRLYSKSSEVGFLEREDEEVAPTIADCHAEKKKNIEILDKLKMSMRKIREQRKQYSDGNSIPSQVPAQPLNL